MNTVMPLIFSDPSADSVNPSKSTVSDHAPVTLHHSKSGGPSAAVDENKLNWKSTVSAAAKLLLRGVKDSADAFGPLKSVAGGLCFILENCEVRSSIRTLTRAPANKSKHTSDRIVGSPSQNARRIVLRACF